MDNGMDPSRGDLDCDSSRAGLMRSQGCRGRRTGGGGGHDLAAHKTIKWWDWRRAARDGLQLGFFFVCIEPG